MFALSGGSSIAGAAVTLESIDTGQKREAVTNEWEYDFPLLLPGSYKLTAKKQGFSTTVLDNINVRVNGGLLGPRDSVASRRSGVKVSSPLCLARKELFYVFTPAPQ